MALIVARAQRVLIVLLITNPTNSHIKTCDSLIYPFTKQHSGQFRRKCEIGKVVYSDMIQKQVVSSCNNISSKKIIRLIWHRKGDLRLHDNELYHINNNNITSSSSSLPSPLHQYNQQRSQPSASSQNEETVTFSDNSNNNIIKIVSLYVINRDDYKPRLITGSQTSEKSSSQNKKSKLQQQKQGNKNNEYRQDDSINNNSLWTVTEGPHASIALIDALSDLRTNLRRLGGELLIRNGNPLIEVSSIVSSLCNMILTDKDDRCNDKHNHHSNINQEEEVILQVVWNEVPGSYEQKLSTKMTYILQQQFQ
jgi:hypothetical protein